MLDTRIVTFSFLLAFIVGCGSKPAAPSANDPKNGPTLPGKTDSTNAPDSKTLAQKQVSDFLIAVKDRKATADALTPEFKRAIAEPVFDADREKGYSDAAATQWLQNLAPNVGNTEARIDFIGSTLAFAVAPGKNGGRAVVRLARNGSGWKVDWFHIATKTLPDVDLSGNEDDAGAKFTSVAFVDSLLRRDYIEAESLMTTSSKASLAPPFSSDKARGYSRAILKTKLESFGGNRERWTIVGTSREGATIQVNGAFQSGEMKTPFVLTLAKGTRPGDWLIEKFELK